MRLGRSAFAWLKWQLAESERAPVGTPAARLTFLSTKRAGSVRAGRLSTHQEPSDEQHRE